MARLYADEDFDNRIADELRKLGHDVWTVPQAGKGGQGIADPDVLAFAIVLGRAVLTFDRWDCIRLHARVRPHAGILVCTRDDDLRALAGRIHQAIASCPKLDNQLLRINRPAIP